MVVIRIVIGPSHEQIAKAYNMRRCFACKSRVHWLRHDGSGWCCPTCGQRYACHTGGLFTLLDETRKRWRWKARTAWAHFKDSLFGERLSRRERKKIAKFAGYFKVPVADYTAAYISRRRQRRRQ